MISFYSQQTLNNGLIAIVDAQKCSWRLARDQIRNITQLLDKNLIKLIALRSDAFSVQNCAKSYKKGEVRHFIVILIMEEWKEFLPQKNVIDITFSSARHFAK